MSSRRGIARRCPTPPTASPAGACPPIAIGPVLPATNTDVLRLEQRLSSVHKQTSFLTIVTAASLVLSGILLVNSL